MFLVFAQTLSKLNVCQLVEQLIVNDGDLLVQSPISGRLVDHQIEDSGPTVFQMKKQSGQLFSDLTFTFYRARVLQHSPFAFSNSRIDFPNSLITN